MGRSTLNNKGIGPLGVLAVIVVLAVAGGAGTYVYHHNHKTKAKMVASTSSTSRKASTSVGTTTKAPDPTAGWTSYTSTSGGFSLKYPSTWVSATNPSQCPDSIFLLGANSNSVGVCGSNNFGQMTVSWQPVKAACGLDSSAWTTTSTKSVTVSGVNGTETTGTAKTGETLPEGTPTIQYCFIKSGTMYVADYNQLSTYPNVLSDFNLMITQTFTFK